MPALSLPLLRRASAITFAAVVVSHFAATAPIATARTRDTRPPSVPSNLSASSATQTAVTFSWGASTDNVRVAGYDVYVGATTKPARVTSLSYAVTGLACAASVNVKVDAYDAAGNRSSAATGTGTASACPAPAPPPSDPPPPPGGSSEPAPIAGQGYHEVFRDDFTSLNRAVWDDHVWYDCCPSASWTGFQQVDSSGVLHLRTSRTMLGSTGEPYPYNTITTQSAGKSFQYGYFEVRMKWPAGHGSWPGFWLYSYKHATDQNQCTTQAGEIDVMEGQGSEPQNWYGTVHSNTNGCAPADDQNANNYQEAGQDLTQGFHTYAVRWTPSSVSWYLDGVQTHSAPTYASDSQPMFLLLQEWTGGWTYDPDATTPDTLDNQIDYVDIWQQ
jgi:hypothetical protein